MARERQGLTQAQLAELTRKTVETISNIERGVTVPSVQTLAIISSALNCPIGDLFLATDAQLRRAPLVSESKLQLLRDEDNQLVEDFINLLVRRGKAPK